MGTSTIGQNISSPSRYTSWCWAKGQAAEAWQDLQSLAALGRLSKTNPKRLGFFIFWEVKK